jgi:hypothetical protein
MSENLSAKAQLWLEYAERPYVNLVDMDARHLSALCRRVIELEAERMAVYELGGPPAEQSSSIPITLAEWVKTRFVTQTEYNGPLTMNARLRREHTKLAPLLRRAARQLHQWADGYDGPRGAHPDPNSTNQSLIRRLERAASRASLLGKGKK